MSDPGGHTMTIPYFGKLMPVHFDVLTLIGWHFGQDPALISSEPERLEQMRTGHAELVRSTGDDFGYDLATWREFLMLHDQDFGYCHPYAFAVVDDAVRAAIADPAFARLAALAAVGGDEWTAAYFARLAREREERLEVVAAKDALLTSRKCPYCGNPCASYRVTCKHCGRGQSPNGENEDADGTDGRRG